jgi:hypothetical protein
LGCSTVQSSAKDFFGRYRNNVAHTRIWWAAAKVNVLCHRKIHQQTHHWILMLADPNPLAKMI